LNPRLSGKILFVFSDPGGAKPILSLIEQSRLDDYLVISDRTYSFYNNFKVQVLICDNNFEEFIDRFRPSLIFTGTSYRSDIEKKFISLAKSKNIPSISFIDHWTAIRKRFENEAGDMVLPDYIWVIDNRARQLCISQGIEKNKIVISGNPYHKWLLHWKPEISKKDFLEQAGIVSEYSKLLLYGPDPLSNINGTGIYGFDEYSATKEIVDVFLENRRLSDKWQVIVLAHPNQDRKKLADSFSGCRNFSLLKEEVNVNHAIYFADIVMGFFSSLLIEADIMNKPILRFFSKPLAKDPLDELSIGKIIDKALLLKELSI